MRLSLYYCICKYVLTMNQLKCLLDFLGTVCQNNLSNLSPLTSRVFGDIHIIYNETYYANVEMKLFLIFEIFINYYHHDHCYHYHNYHFIYN